MGTDSLDPGVIIFTAIFGGLWALWVGVLVRRMRSRTRRVAERAHAALVRGWTADADVRERLGGSGVLFRFRGQTRSGAPWVLEAERWYERTRERRRKAFGLTAWRIGEPASGDPTLLLLLREIWQPLQEAQGNLGGWVATRLLNSRLKPLGEHDSTLADMLSRRRAVLQTPELQEQYVALVADDTDVERLVTLHVERALLRTLTLTAAAAGGDTVPLLCFYLAPGTLRVVEPVPIDIDHAQALEALVDLGAALEETALVPKAPA